MKKFISEEEYNAAVEYIESLRLHSSLYFDAEISHETCEDIVTGMLKELSIAVIKPFQCTSAVTGTLGYD